MAPVPTRPAVPAAAPSLACSAIALAVAVGLLPACMSFTPPVRSPGYGAPGRIRQGQLELGGGIAKPGSPGAGGPFVGYGVRDWVSVELGADFFFGRWAMGYLGGRFTYAPRRDHKLHGALDGELGVGAGVGGDKFCGLLVTCADTRRWSERTAFGAYAGGGAGYHFHFFALYARGRIQTSAAEGLPATVYGNLHGGLQFRIARHLDLFTSAGLLGAHNREGHVLDVFYDVGLSVYFDVVRRPRPAARRSHFMSF